MDKNFEKEVKVYHNEKLRIFPSEMPSSWQMTSIIAEHFYKRGYKQAIEQAIAWLKANAEDYIVDCTPTYPDAPSDLIIGGRCWEDLKEAMK